MGYVHEAYMELSLASGHRVVFTRDDVPSPAECLRVGCVVEKRAMELGFRIDGRYEHPASASWRVTPVRPGVGLRLIVIGLLRRRSCDNRLATTSKRPDGAAGAATSLLDERQDVSRPTRGGVRRPGPCRRVRSYRRRRDRAYSRWPRCCDRKHLAVQVSRRRLLSSGTAAVGRVVSANNAKGILAVEYEYPTPSGTMRGSTGIDLMRVQRAFGFVPGENDTAFIVFDPAQPRRSAHWGFAKR